MIQSPVSHKTVRNSDTAMLNELVFLNQIPQIVKDVVLAHAEEHGLGPISDVDKLPRVTFFGTLNNKIHMALEPLGAAFSLDRYEDMARHFIRENRREQRKVQIIREVVNSYCDENLIVFPSTSVTMMKTAFFDAIEKDVDSAFRRLGGTIEKSDCEDIRSEIGRYIEEDRKSRRRARSNGH